MARKKRKKTYSRPDRFSQQAKDDGYMARSVYKLQEIQKRTRILKQGARVVDLGCFPGSWSQYAMQQIGGRGTLVGVDFEAPKVAGAIWIDRSIYDVTSEELQAALGGPADVVLSDMAPNTSGTRDSDHFLQIELARQALRVAIDILKPGGSFVCKIFEGAEAQAFQQETRAVFKVSKRMRPDAIRKSSREWFMVAQDFKKR